MIDSRSDQYFFEGDFPQSTCIKSLSIFRSKHLISQMQNSPHSSPTSGRLLMKGKGGVLCSRRQEGGPSEKGAVLQG